MKPSGLVVLATHICCAALRAGDATTPIDYAQRNSPYAPATGMAPMPQKPSVNNAVQGQVVSPVMIEKQHAAWGDRSAPIDVAETREKQVRALDSRRPETQVQRMSPFNQRTAGVSTGADVSKPPTVAKYQDSLTAASATNMARFPAMHRATKAKLNRFVFQKNPPDTNLVTAGTAVRPAAGGSSVQQK